MKASSLQAVVCSLVLWGAALAQPAVFTLEEVTPGLTGYGLTAGPGNLIERFSVEVLAVQEDLGPGFPLVLIRVGGDAIERSGGVAAGMSGSPIYIDERLLGALAYAFPQSDHRLALVTPIETIMRTDPRARAEQVGSMRHEGQALGAAMPVQTPIVVTGLSARASSGLMGLFPAETLPMQTGRMSAQQDARYLLEPGSAVSVQLVRGDVTVAAIGTVTLIDDGRIWAFGHPLLGRGAVSLALAPAYVSHIVPNLDLPFKLANTGARVLGSITQDRPHGVSGLLDEPPDFIPIRLSFRGPGRELEKRFEVTSDERFYAPLAHAASVQVIDEILEQLGGGTVAVAWDITLDGGQRLALEEQTVNSEDIAAAAAALAAAPLELLATNPFAEPHISSVHLSFDYEPQLRVAEVVRVVAENEELEPGSTLLAHVRLQAYRGDPHVETMRIPIPADVPGGYLDISIRGGMEPTPADASRGDNAILSFYDLLGALEARVQSSEIVAEAYVDGEYRLLTRTSMPFLVQGFETVFVTVLGPEEEAMPAPVPEEQPDQPLPKPPVPAEPPVPPVPLRRQN